MDFSQLSEELKLNNKLEAEEQRLARLKKWCFEHVSTDIHFSGNTTEQLEQYLHLAKHFLDDYLAKIASDENGKFEEMNAIQYAAYQGYDSYLASLPPATNWNTSTASQMSPLHFAALSGNLNTVKVLLEKGANPKQLNADEQYPIFSALILPASYEKNLKEKKQEIFKILIELTPEVFTHHDQSGDSLLHLLIVHGFLESAKEILKKDASLAFCHNNFSHYPIHAAILTLSNKLDIVEQLLAIKNVPGLADAKERVALHYAALYGTKDMVRLCAKYTPNINIFDEENKTALHLAIEAKNLEAVKALFELGANDALTDKRGNTIIHYAVLSMDTNLLQWVLANSSVEVNQKNKDDISPLSLSENYTEIKQLLLEKGAYESNCFKM